MVVVVSPGGSSSPGTVEVVVVDSTPDTATAMASWQRANTLWANRPDAHYNLGVVYSQRGDMTRATLPAGSITRNEPAMGSRKSVESATYGTSAPGRWP